MKKPVLTISHRKITYYEHPHSGRVHGMMSIPVQFQPTLRIRKGTHYARLLRMPRDAEGEGRVFLVKQREIETVPAYTRATYDKCVEIRVTATNLFIKIPAKGMAAFGITLGSHEVSWTLFSDQSLEGHIQPKENI